ncbi:hypothetical protein AAEX28_12850 [Lentisphaerota bacterium WC36G]|nr:hypothetical protein LJT99_15670 [Lentisphaerae bacterium WC36]
MDVIDKVIKVAEAGDFINTLYQLKNSKNDDNVKYFLDVKKAFNTAGDYLEGAFGKIPGIGDFIRMYNRAFKAVDGVFKKVANYVKKIEKELKVMDKAFGRVRKRNIAVDDLAR